MRLIISSILATIAPMTVAAQTGGYLVRLGNDTIAVERYERTANRIEGQIVRRSPATSVLRYTLAFNDDGSVASYEQSVLRPDGSAAPNTTPQRMTFTGDSVLRQVTQNGQAVTLRAAAPRGTLPGITGSILFNELVVGTVKRLGAAQVMGFNPQQSAPIRADMRLISADSAELVSQGFRTGFKLSPEGKVLRSDGSLTTQKFIATAVANPNIGTIASAWAAKDAAGQALGAASTRDTVQAVVGGANIWIDYGRPAARGRAIWGALVPNDTTWRLGANAATQFRTDKDLVMGGVAIPAGTYTLFLYPRATEAWLIVNKQTGQWGTAYDAKQDLARVPLQLHMNQTTAEERFRIYVAGNELMLHWDKGGYGVKIETR